MPCQRCKITRRKLLIGLAAGVAVATAAATLVRTTQGLRPHAKQWYPTAYHNVMVSDPDSSWRKTEYPGNYDEAIPCPRLTDNEVWYWGRQNGRPRA